MLALADSYTHGAARGATDASRARPFSPSPVAWNGVPWVCLALGALLAAVQQSVVGAAGLYIWAASIVLLGLPHGACDPLVSASLRRRSWSPRDTALFYGAYLVAAGLVIGLWILSPTVGLLFFLGLTMWHWGSADVIARGHGGSRYVAGGLARGVIVILSPLAFHPAASGDMFARLMAVMDPGHAPAHGTTTPSLLLGAVRVAVGCAAGAELLGIGRDARRGEVRRAAAAGIELALLLALYLLAPPVTAVGLYFVAWHSWRHILRVGSLFEDGAVSAGQLVARYYARAWPLTAVSIAGLVVVAGALHQHGLSQLVAVYLVLISAVTLPHAVVVALWDRQARYTAWRPRPGR